MISLKSRIYVSGHKGLVGSAIVRQLKSRGYKNIICKTRKELDLTNQNKVFIFLKKTKPDFIFLAAAKVGGIYSNNKYKADYIYENLSIPIRKPEGGYFIWFNLGKVIEKDDVKVKELVVEPGKGMSFQKHFKRHEIWLVSRGSCVVNYSKSNPDDKENIILTSTYDA